MALVLKDRVKETTTTTGTGTLTLLGASTGYQSFSAIGNTNTCYYAISSSGGSQWEVGIGTYTASGTTLSRDTILGSSTGGAAISLSAGTKDVYVVYPAGKSVWLDASSNVSPLGTIASGTWNGSTIGVTYGGTGQSSALVAGSVVYGLSTAAMATTAAGTTGQVLTSAGAGTPTWTTPTTGTVTSITAGTGLSGGAITTSGTIAIDATVATLSGTQTFTNKTFTGFTETVYAVSDGAGVALSPTNGTIQTWTLGASRTPTAGTWAAGQSMTMMINDGTAYTITWTSLAVTWVGNAAPTLATSGFTVIELWKVGTTIYGALVGSVA